MKRYLLTIFIGLLFFSCSTSRNSGSANQITVAQENFWSGLQSLCGRSFYGKIIEAPATDTVFRNKELILHIRSCETNLIKMPFIVGNNRSRTFIFTKTQHGIQLQHDHRHADGLPDSITMYGGHTSNSGSSLMQIFPADQHTVNILPAAMGNVWWIEIKEGKFIRYNLRRIGTDRLFTVEFDLNTSAAQPSAPWGWKD